MLRRLVKKIRTKTQTGEKYSRRHITFAITIIAYLLSFFYVVFAPEAYVPKLFAVVVLLMAVVIYGTSTALLLGLGKAVGAGAQSSHKVIQDINKNTRENLDL